MLSFMDFALGVFLQAERSKCLRAVKLLYSLTQLKLACVNYADFQARIV